MVRHLKDTLVGIFIIAGIVLFIVLYTWLSGRISLRNTYDVIVYFDDVTGLRIGDPATVYGLEKGKVKLLKVDQNKVKTTIALDKSILLSEDSKIVIRSVSYVGSDRFVKIVPGRAENKAVVFQGYNETLDLESMVNQFDSLMIIIRSLKPEELDLSKIAKKLSQNIDKNIGQLTEMVKGPTDKIENLVVRLDSLSQLIEGDGTIGKLLKSDELYEEVRETNQALKNLIEDIKENPKKYINVKVF
jgi:ABC-type transporter Mla subunit MlaD